MVAVLVMAMTRIWWAHYPAEALLCTCPEVMSNSSCILHAVTEPFFLTANRYCLWASVSLLNLGLGLKIYLFLDTTTLLWVLSVPCLIGIFVAQLVYVLRLANRPNSLRESLLNSLRFPIVMLSMQRSQLFLVRWLSRSWKGSSKLIGPIFDVLFIFFVGLDFAILAEYLTKAIQIDWARAEEFFNPSEDPESPWHDFLSRWLGIGLHRTLSGATTDHGKIVWAAIRDFMRLTTVFGAFLLSIFVILPLLILAWPTQEELQAHKPEPVVMYWFGSVSIQEWRLLHP